MGEEKTQIEGIDLASEVAELRRTVSATNSRLSEPMMKTLGRNFLIGIAFGLGSFLGATLVVSFLIYSLSSIDFVPILGDWAVEIANRIKQGLESR